MYYHSHDCYPAYLGKNLMKHLQTALFCNGKFLWYDWKQRIAYIYALIIKNIKRDDHDHETDECESDSEEELGDAPPTKKRKISKTKAKATATKKAWRRGKKSRVRRRQCPLTSKSNHSKSNSKSNSNTNTSKNEDVYAAAVSELMLASKGVPADEETISNSIIAATKFHKNYYSNMVIPSSIANLISQYAFLM